MAEFVEVMKYRKRMCAMYRNHSCRICPIYDVKEGTCANFLIENTQEAEEIIMKWAKENPIKTNADKFKEVFGVDIYKEPTHNCTGIRCGINECEECKYNGFWNKEYKEPKEEK